jgi:hypothetical protein
MMNLFAKKNLAVKRWRSKAWSIDIRRTRITILDRSVEYGVFSGPDTDTID